METCQCGCTARLCFFVRNILHVMCLFHAVIFIRAACFFFLAKNMEFLSCHWEELITFA